MSVVIIQIIASITYIPQLTALSRQVIGFSFFAGIILVLFDPTWDRKKKTLVILVLTCGLSFSHYSSAYICSAIFLISGLLSFLLWRIDFFRRKTLKPVATLGLGLSILLITFLWNGLLNNSAQDVNLVAKNIYQKGPQILPNKTQDFINRWLTGALSTSAELTPEEFKAKILQFNAQNYPNFQIQPVSLTYEIRIAQYPDRKPTLGATSASLFYWLYVVFNTIFQGLILIQILSILIIIFGKLYKRDLKTLYYNKIDLHSSSIDIFTLTCVSLSIAIFLRISASNIALYSPERVALQLAFIFSLPIATLIERIMGRSQLTDRIGLISLLFSSFIFLQQATGLIGYINGTSSSRISSNINEDRPFVISESEVKAAHWIYKNIPKDFRLQSDITANLVNTQFNIFETRPFIDQTSPFGIFRNSYVYLSKANLETGITRQSIGGLRNIQVPFDYLNQNHSTVYSSEGARVYR
jgi:hypothetical protein